MTDVASSILNSVKHNCGIEEDYTVYDLDFVTYINGAFADLNDIGVGPSDGFQITDATQTWADFLPGNDPRMSRVQVWTCLRVRLLFDPPATSFAIAAIETQLNEMYWRINTMVDTDLIIEGETP